MTPGFGLRTMVGQLRTDVTSPSRQGTFELARARRAAFATHASTASVLAALSDDRDSTYPEREQLTQALLAECRAQAEPVWRSMLVVAYYPLLSRLRRRIVGDAVPREDLDQLVLTAFLSAIDALLPHECVDRTAMRLRQRTERQVFRLLRRARQEQEVPTAIHDLGPDAATLGVLPDEQEDQQEVSERARTLVRVAQGAVADRSLDVLVATVIRRESLRDYVQRTVQGGVLVRERAYQRLKRQRTRALQKLRALLAVPPASPASGC